MSAVHLCVDRYHMASETSEIEQMKKTSMNVVGGLVKPELDNSHDMSYIVASYSKYSQKGCTIFEKKGKIPLRFLPSRSHFVSEEMEDL